MRDVLAPPRLALFDFGGVLAEEGFLAALDRLAQDHGRDPAALLQAGIEAMYGSGYLVNAAPEAAFWERFEALAGLRLDRPAAREAILAGCVPRPWMLALASRLAGEGIRVAVLSDHTDWLDELERRHGFGMYFDAVFNSFHTGFTKRQPESFRHALAHFGLEPADALFIDDARRNVAQARELGLAAIQYETREAFEIEILRHIPAMPCA